MKKIPLLILIFFIYSCSNYHTSYSKESDLVKLNLKDDVKSVKVQPPRIIKEGKKSIQNSGPISIFNRKGNLVEYTTGDPKKEKYIYKYDSNGNRIKLIKYISNNLVHTMNYKYDEKDSCIEKNLYFSDGKLFGNYINKFDNDNNKTEELSYDSDNKLFRIDTFKYDKNNNKIEHSNYNSLDRLLSKKTYKYDDYNNVIEKKGFGLNGEYLGKDIYEYDSNGNTTKEIRYSNDDILIYKRFYKYDDMENQIEYIAYNSEGNLNEKHNSKYDNLGNLIEYIAYNLNDNLSKKYNYKYTFDDKNNWTKCIKYESNESKSLTERKIEYF